MRVLYVEFSSGFGGSSQALAHQLKHLDRGFTPIVVVAREAGNFLEIRSSGVEVIPMPPRRIRGGGYLGEAVNLILDVAVNAPAIARLIRGRNVDLVHINNNIKDNLPAIFAARAAGVPCVCHMRGTRPLVRKERLFGRWVDRMVVLNQDALRIMEGHFGKGKAAVIDDGIDLAEYDAAPDGGAALRESWGAADVFCAGVVGRLVEGKGQEDFIEAAAILGKSGRKGRYLIVGGDPDGDGTWERRLRARTADLGLEDAVIFTGWRSDKQAVISALDVLVQSSSTFPEGAPLVCAEAMALGKPVVATDIPGSREMVVHGRTGLLVSPGDPRALADALARLMDDPEGRRRMGRAGRARVEERFDVSKNARRFERLYESLVARRDRGSSPRPLGMIEGGT